MSQKTAYGHVEAATDVDEGVQVSCRLPVAAPGYVNIVDWVIAGLEPARVGQTLMSLFLPLEEGSLSDIEACTAGSPGFIRRQYPNGCRLRANEQNSIVFQTDRTSVTVRPEMWVAVGYHEESES